MSQRPYSILIFADSRRTHANTSLDHLDAFQAYSRHRVYYYDPLQRSGSRHLDLDEFDVVVLHYSVVAYLDSYLHPFFRDKLAAYQGLKVQFIQDDYRCVQQLGAAVRSMGIHVLFTLYAPEKIERIYGPTLLPATKVLSTLAGYVPDNIVGMPTQPLARRPIDVGYRGRQLPYWLGHLGQEKTRIVADFLRHAAGSPLQCDISSKEEDRIYGKDWPAFLQSCKTMLGTESGASITDFDGSAEARTRAYLQEHPEASYADVHAAVLSPYEGNLVHNCISPRVFETAAMRTALVLYRGDYSGILKPWIHYLPLEKDFSNFALIADRIGATDFLEGMVEAAYRDLITSGRYSYRSFISEFDSIVDQYGRHHGAASKRRYDEAVREPLPWHFRLRRAAKRALATLRLR